MAETLIHKTTQLLPGLFLTSFPSLQIIVTITVTIEYFQNATNSISFSSYKPYHEIDTTQVTEKEIKLSQNLVARQGHRSLWSVTKLALRPDDSQSPCYPAIYHAAPSCSTSRRALGCRQVLSAEHGCYERW